MSFQFQGPPLKKKPEDGNDSPPPKGPYKISGLVSIAGSGGTVQIRHYASPDSDPPLATSKGSYIWDQDLLDDGEILAVGGPGNTVDMFHLQKTAYVSDLPGSPPASSGSEDVISGISYGKTPKKLAAGADAKGGGHTNLILGVAAVRDSAGPAFNSRCLTAAEDNTAKIWRWRKEPSPSSGVPPSASDWLVDGSDKPEVLATFPHPDGNSWFLHCIHIPEHDCAAFISESKLVLVDLVKCTIQTVSTINAVYLSSIQFDPLSDRLYVTNKDGGFQAFAPWEDKDKPVASVPRRAGADGHENVISLILHPNCTDVAAGTGSGAVLIYDLRGGKSAIATPGVQPKITLPHLHGTAGVYGRGCSVVSDKRGDMVLLTGGDDSRLVVSEWSTGKTVTAWKIGSNVNTIVPLLPHAGLLAAGQIAMEKEERERVKFLLKKAQIEEAEEVEEEGEEPKKRKRVFGRSVEVAVGSGGVTKVRMWENVLLAWKVALGGEETSLSEIPEAVLAELVGVRLTEETLTRILLGHTDLKRIFATEETLSAAAAVVRDLYGVFMELRVLAGSFAVCKAVATLAPIHVAHVIGLIHREESELFVPLLSACVDCFKSLDVRTSLLSFPDLIPIVSKVMGRKFGKITVGDVIVSPVFGDLPSLSSCPPTLPAFSKLAVSSLLSRRESSHNVLLVANDGTKEPVHIEVLVLRLNFIHRLLSFGDRESEELASKGELRVASLTGNAMKALIEFAYTREISPTHSYSTLALVQLLLHSQMYQENFLAAILLNLVKKSMADEAEKVEDPVAKVLEWKEPLMSFGGDMRDTLISHWARVTETDRAKVLAALG